MEMVLVALILGLVDVDVNFFKIIFITTDVYDNIFYFDSSSTKSECDALIFFVFEL